MINLHHSLVAPPRAPLYPSSISSKLHSSSCMVTPRSTSLYTPLYHCLDFFALCSTFPASRPLVPLRPLQRLLHASLYPLSVEVLPHSTQLGSTHPSFRLFHSLLYPWMVRIHYTLSPWLGFPVFHSTSWILRFKARNRHPRIITRKKGEREREKKKITKKTTELEGKTEGKKIPHSFSL